MKKKKFYHKLVRDKIPDIIIQKGKKVESRILSTKNFQNELEEALRNKILEECYELFHAQKKEEILKEGADLLEIFMAFLKAKGITWKEVEECRIQRKKERGGFDKNIFLISVEEDISDKKDGEKKLETRPSLSPQPLFPFPTVITNREESFYELFLKELEESSSLFMGSAFFSLEAFHSLHFPLQDFLRSGSEIRFLTSCMNHFNRPQDFLSLQKLLPEMKFRVYLGEKDIQLEDPAPLHLKVFLFQKKNKPSSMIIGSSNFTLGGLQLNQEWNYYSFGEIHVSFQEKSPFEKALQEFERLWERSFSLSELEENGYFQALEEIFYKKEEARLLKRDTSEPALFVKEPLSKWTSQNPDKCPQLKPKEEQKKALKNLQTLRYQGVDKAAVIAATGFGKTVLSAFDFQQSGMENFLFLAHRELILQNAKAVFQRVLGKDPGSIFKGGQAGLPFNLKERSKQNLFAMVQTLKNRTSQFPRDYFDYIILDEFHHAAASTYDRILQYFQPRFLLGMTATPERMDGRDVLKYCDYNIAYEIRLFDAIEKGYLSPFLYFAIYDETDYSKVRWQRGKYN
ncbi:MAG: NgoFVII family restriction endonuclease, partial [Planctomycetota bacterium]